jgi:hypothetical protein
VKHRGIEYGVEEVRPGAWRWIIYQMTEVGSRIMSDPEYPNQGTANIACVNKINSELGAANDA